MLLENIKVNEVKYIHSYNKEDCFIYNKEDVNYNRNCKKILIFLAYTQFRILSNFKIYFNRFKIKNIFSKKPKENFFNVLLKQVQNQCLPTYDVIFHVHGGGFFSQTSESSLCYLVE